MVFRKSVTFNGYKALDKPAEKLCGKVLVPVVELGEEIVPFFFSLPLSTFFLWRKEAKLRSEFMNDRDFRGFGNGLFSSGGVGKISVVVVRDSDEV